MIELKDVPANGQLIITAFFGAYSSYMQNESRRLLLHVVPSVAETIGVKVDPLTFGILRHVEFKVSRPIGITYAFAYSRASTQDFKALFLGIRKKLTESKQASSMWSRFDILVAAGVSGVEENVT